MKVSRTRNYLVGLITGYLVTFVTVAVGLWLTPFTLRFLDREEYAIFVLSSDLLMWLNLLDLGITAGLNVHAAHLTGCPDQDRLNRLASTAFFVQMAVVSFVVLAGAGLAWGCPKFFSIRPDLQAQAVHVVFLLALGSAMTLGTQTFSALLVAHQQIHIDNLIRLALIALRTVLTVLFLVWGWQVLSLAVASVAATGITAALSILRCFRSVPGLSIRYRLVSWKMLRSLGNLGIWFSLGGLAGMVIQGFDRIVAARLISLESVTTLSLTGRVYFLVGGMLAQITSTARPALGQLIGQGKLDEAYRTYRHLFALSTGGALVAALSLWAGNGAFVPWWVGKQNYGGGLLDLFLATNLMVHSWVLPNRAALTAGLVVRPQVLSRLIEGFLNLALAIGLGIKYGLLGIVLSTAIAGVLTSLWYLPHLTAKMFHHNVFRLIWDDMAPIIMICLLLAPIAWWLRSMGLKLGGISGVFLASGVTMTMGLFFLWKLGFNSALRHRVRSTLAMGFKTS